MCFFHLSTKMRRENLIFCLDVYKLFFMKTENSFLECCVTCQVPLYITAQTLGATAATLVGVSVYGVNADIMATKPALSCVSAFFVELIATSIVVFLASALHCGPHQNVSDQIDLRYSSSPLVIKKYLLIRITPKM